MIARAGSAARVALPTSFVDDPVTAYELAIATYFAIGSFSVFVWDSFYNLEHDIRLLRTHGRSLPSAIYFTSRVSTWVFAILETIRLTVPIKNCQHYHVSTLIFYNLFIAATTLLSYFRVCAIWNGNTTARFLFALFWLCGVAGSLTTATGVMSQHISNSPYCTEIVVGQYVSAAVLGPMINHLAVFLAITYGVCKICADNHDKLTFRAGYRVFVLGESLPTFSKAILQACQLCYLVATVAGIITVVWFYVFAHNYSYRIAMFVPYAVTVNIMFSWVFRRAKLGMCVAAHGAGPMIKSKVATVAATVPGARPDAMEMHPDFISATDADASSVAGGKRNYGGGSSGSGGTKRSGTPSSHLEIEVNRVVEYKHDYVDVEVGKGIDPIDITFNTFTL
ncbi:hypothetical protein JR316_0012123 [Psilocybe cubensis]|uniref:Transmembrane protein n=2 Tax=Psilocybe cubensis TaxID=181762 RepID=A0A8H8CGP6_PSICU|nr:hypothetical protein JR316_0012123 [Psilocybe cubensis]KAH9475022.1 hypothetical protein JR316_0012123 [Psilocybe cubensis]